MRKYIDDKYFEIIAKENPDLLREHYKNFRPCLQEIRGENVDSEVFLDILIVANFWILIELQNKEPKIVCVIL